MEPPASRTNSATIAMATAIAVIASAALLGVILEPRHAPAKGIASWSLRGDVSSREPQTAMATPS